jgi:hypothetical protein
MFELIKSKATERVSVMIYSKQQKKLYGKSKHISDGKDSNTVTNQKILVVLFTSDKVDKSRYPEKIGLRKQSMAN